MRSFRMQEWNWNGLTMWGCESDRDCMWSFCERAGRKGSALMSGRRVIFRRIFPEGSCKRWESVFSE
ncbi:hypothetical protein HMPREF1547_01119 [Blautia sp. KLE 1732]|nr:hypothetical protein HMPREF1547_01119 [Blautia sp. KLE 1732]